MENPLRPDNLAGLAINALDVSRDGRFAVIGREDGFLIRYEIAALAAGGNPLVFQARPGQGPVEALAMGPAGRWSAPASPGRSTPEASGRR